MTSRFVENAHAVIAQCNAETYRDQRAAMEKRAARLRGEALSSTGAHRIDDPESFMACMPLARGVRKLTARNAANHGVALEVALSAAYRRGKESASKPRALHRAWALGQNFRGGVLR